MIIRNVRENDALSLKSLLVQLGYPLLEQRDIQHQIRLHSQEGYHILVAEIQDEVVGLIALHYFEYFHLNGKLGRISTFCVDEHFRSQGIGIKLLEESEIFFKQKGCVRVEITSNIRRTATHPFYLNRGYKENSKRFIKDLG